MMRSGWRKMTRGERCPVCEKPDNCSLSLDGDAVFCRRVSMGGIAGRGGWVHKLRDDAPVTTRPRAAAVRPSAPVVERASVEQLDAVYSAMLRECLTLSDTRKAGLLRRGLTASEIARNLYRDTPDAAASERIADHLRGSLSGVPGFYLRGGGSDYQMRSVPAGVFIPYRDPLGRISGLQFRPDETRAGFGKYVWLSTNPEPDARGAVRFPGGCSSGAPLHFARCEMMRDAAEVTLSEGALKSDVASQFLNAPVIAGAGATLFGRDFGSRLASQFPKLKTVAVAFDSDFRVNQSVRAALETLLRDLSAAHFRVRVRTWPEEWKGIDDYLLALSLREVRRAA